MLVRLSHSFQRIELTAGRTIRWLGGSAGLRLRVEAGAEETSEAGAFVTRIRSTAGAEVLPSNVSPWLRYVVEAGDDTGLEIWIEGVAVPQCSCPEPDPDPPPTIGPGGRVYTGSRPVTADAVASAGEHITINQGGGPGLTIQLPPSSASAPGTAIAVSVMNAGFNTLNTIAVSDPEDFIVNADGTDDPVTSFGMGDFNQDFGAVFVVADEGDHWNRVDRRQGAISAPNLVNPFGDGTATTSGDFYVSSWGPNGVIIRAYNGGAVTISGDAGAIFPNGFYVLPSPPPATPAVGFALFCDESDGIAKIVYPTGAHVPIPPL